MEYAAHYACSNRAPPLSDHQLLDYHDAAVIAWTPPGPGGVTIAACFAQFALEILANTDLQVRICFAFLFTVLRSTPLCSRSRRLRIRADVQITEFVCVLLGFGSLVSGYQIDLM